MVNILFCKNDLNFFLVLNQQIFQLSCNCNLRLWDFDLHACTNQESSIQRSIDFLKIAEDLAQPDKI